MCAELLEQRAGVCWLYDRFAVRTWLRWRRRGVDQLHGSGPRDARLPRIERQFREFRPDALVLDEDATPFARAAVAAARRCGVPSVVVQHGVPRVRFGFAPLAADYFFAWGESTRRQLLRWGVPAGRIRVTGCAKRPLERRAPRASWGPGEILFLATTPPRDDRPDAVSFHLTTATHAAMVRAACAAVAGIPGARLTIKRHPRCRGDDVFREIAGEFPGLPHRIVSRGGLVRYLAEADCVINCTSGAGVEAAAAGWPVIELIPDGSEDLLPADEWGSLATVQSAAELESLLRDVLSGRVRQQPFDFRQVFARTGRAAAQAIAEELGALECGDLSPLFVRRRAPKHRYAGSLPS